ncbi:MAG: hypothetical protein IPG45_38570 [Deltaproteobacteria bacterium]|jgi:cysteine-rich repeat protein|nr:hypothetical protein [Deltaproteobacteria bacterium]
MRGTAKFGPAVVVWGLVACGSEELGKCPSTHALDSNQICRVSCLADSDCFPTEMCSSALLCVPKADQGPEIVRFVADRNPVAEGEEVTLEYVALFAEKVRLSVKRGGSTQPIAENEALVDTFIYQATQGDVVLELEALRGEVRVTKELALTVTSANKVQILSFTADAIQVRAGDRVKLEWVLQNEESFRVETSNGQTLAIVEGSVAFDNPTETTEYTLVAEGPGGPVQAKVTVEVVIDPVELTIDVLEISAPAEARPGDNGVIKWRTTGASRLRVREVRTDRVLFETADPRVAAEGRWLLAFQETGNRTYELAVEGQGTQGTRVVAVNVTPWLDPPSLTNVQVAPTVGPQRMDIDVSWTVEPADTPILILDQSSGESWSVEGETTATIPGDGATRRLLVRAENESGVAEELVVAWRLQNELEDNAQIPQPIDGVAIDGVLENPNDTGDLDRFQLTVPAQGSLAVQLKGACLSFITLRILDPQQQPLQESAGGGLGDCPGVLTATGLTGGVYEVQVESEILIGDSYVLIADPRAPICGDGATQVGESCDDGARLKNDGCDGYCQAEPHFQYAVSVVPPEPSEPTALPLDFDLVAPVLGAELADRGVGVVELPFDLPFFGQRYRGVMVHVDGFAGFTPAIADGPVLAPDAPNAVLALFAGDLRLRGGGARIFASAFMVNEAHGVAITYERVGLQVAVANEMTGTVALVDDGRLAVRYRSLVGSPAREVEAGLQGPSGAPIFPVPCMNSTPGSTSCPIGGLPNGQLVQFTPAGRR